MPAHPADLTRPLEVRRVRISKVNPAPYNPRKDLQPGDPEYQALARSLDEFGFVEPLVWNQRTGHLVGGHQRFKILVARGLREVDVSVVDLPLEREKALTIALNKVEGDWDEVKLGALLKELQDMPGPDATITGFSQREIDHLLRDLEPPKPEPDENVEQATKAARALKVVRGQVWLLGRHRLLCGDATDADDMERLMNGARVQAILTDPPYGMDKDIVGDEERALWRLHRDAFARLPVLEDATMICFHGTRRFPVALDAAERSGWQFQRMLWLSKPNDVTYPWRGWILKSEAILVFARGKGSWVETHPFHHDTYEHNWAGREFEEKGKELVPGTSHPTVKPLVVVVDLLERICPAAGLVVDPFLGSGTTLIAAEQTGRTCYGLEIESRYCAVAIARWELYTGAKATLYESPTRHRPQARAAVRR
jgi:DNA modification methylase